jgi:histidinol-phosphate aminotransferase
MSDPRLTPLAAALPATVPFTGPEALERRMG